MQKQEEEKTVALEPSADSHHGRPPEKVRMSEPGGSSAAMKSFQITIYHIRRA